MKRISIAVVVVAGLLVFRCPEATAQAAATTEMQFAKFYVGSWNCAHTVGNFSGTYTTIIENALDGRWLKQTYDFPTLGDASGPARAEYFIGYDPRVQSWIRFGAMTDGMYFAMRGKRSGNVWTWGYVLPGTSGSAVYTKVSESEYTVDGPSYVENGQQVTEHHSCRRSS